MSTALKVEHCKKAFEFIIRLDGLKSMLQYRELPSRILDLYHTEVPTVQQGRGIARQLVNEAFNYALANNYKVLPTCTYVQTFVQKWASNEQKKLIIDDSKSSI